jgi:hypothetical protein
MKKGDNIKMHDYDESQKELQPASQPSQQNEPQQRPRHVLFILLIILAGVVVTGAGGFMVWQSSAHSTASSPTNTKIALGSQTGESTSGAGEHKGPGIAQPTVPGQNDPRIYWDTIQAQFAQGTHLSVAEAQQKLQAANAQTKSQHSTDPGAPVSAVAQQQGISTDQLRRIEINAIQQGCAKLVSQGALTQQQADQRVQTAQSWDQSTLNQYILRAFTINQSTQKH